MSFGFSVGDLITVIELANRIRKHFSEAPAQFKEISDEYALPGFSRATLISI
jgi:hypothetical protein